MKSEAKLQSKVIKYLREHGYFVIKTQGGTPGTPIGTPDVIALAKGGLFVGLEFKRPDGKGVVSPEQKAIAAQIIQSGGEWFEIHNWQMFEEAWMNNGF